LAARDFGALATGPLVVALEDWYGSGLGVVAAGLLDDGRVLVWGRLLARRSAGIQHATTLVANHPGSRLVVGSTLAADPDLGQVGAGEPVPATAGHIRSGLALIRELLAAGRLVHDGGPDLADQVTHARVRQGPVGLVLGRGRADLVRAACAALVEAVGTPATPPARFVIR